MRSDLLDPVADQPAVTVGPRGRVEVPLTLTSDAFAAAGTYGFAITAVAPSGIRDSVQGTLTLAGPPVPPDPEARGIVVALTPARGTAGQGTPARFVVRLTNVGSVADTFSLAVAGLPPGVAAAFEQGSAAIAPGASVLAEKVVPERGAVRFAMREAGVRA